MSRESELLEYMRYHRSAMEDRRRTQLKIFTGLVALELLVAAGLLEHKDALGSLGLKAFAVTFFVLILLFFGIAIWTIERANKVNQGYFLAINDTLRDAYKISPAPRRWHWKVFEAWAGLWPFLVVAALTVISVRISLALL